MQSRRPTSRRDLHLQKLIVILSARLIRQNLLPTRGISHSSCTGKRPGKRLGRAFCFFPRIVVVIIDTRKRDSLAATKAAADELEKLSSLNRFISLASCLAKQARLPGSVHLAGAACKIQFPIPASTAKFKTLFKKCD